MIFPQTRLPSRLLQGLTSAGVLISNGLYLRFVLRDLHISELESRNSPLRLAQFLSKHDMAKGFDK